jgi:hypothetical protein
MIPGEAEMEGSGNGTDCELVEVGSDSVGEFGFTVRGEAEMEGSGKSTDCEGGELRSDSSGELDQQLAVKLKRKEVLSIGIANASKLDPILKVNSD